MHSVQIAITVAVVLIVLMIASLRIVQQYERGVVFLLGRVHGPARGGVLGAIDRRQRGGHGNAPFPSRGAYSNSCARGERKRAGPLPAPGGTGTAGAFGVPPVAFRMAAAVPPR